MSRSPKPREEVIGKIRDVFREYGYDGATLSLISKATGLGRASLYHHFPDGKEAMADEALDDVSRVLDQHVIGALRGPGSLKGRVAHMLRQLDTYYEGGEATCLLGVMALTGSKKRLEPKVAALFEKWIDAMAAVAKEAGLAPKLARQRAEEAVARIQGGLVLSAAFGESKPFRAALDAVPHLLLEP